jgi:hypothetical protein
MSISQNFSVSRPSLNLNFARSKTLDPRITFTRTSTATFVDEDGFIKTADVNTPRFDHDPITGESLGLLIEGPRTNLILRSEEFNDSSFWGRPVFNLIGVTANAITSPDGTVDADLVVNQGGVTSLLEQIVTIPASSTNDYYVTIYAKRGTTSYFTFNCYYSGNVEFNVDFNFDTGVANGVPISGEFIFQNVGNGWYRCGFRVPRDATGTRTQFLFRMWPSGRGQTSGNTYFWGAQLEQGAFPTSYIPTTTATVTRTLDNASITGTNFSNWYNPNEGTVIVRARSFNLTASTFPVMAIISDGTANNVNLLSYITNSLGGVITTVASVTQTELYPSATTNPRKGSYSYKLNNFITCFNGGTVLTDNSGSVPTSVNRMNIGQHVALDPIYSLDGYISELTYYPNALSAAQLQTLTR